MRLHLVTDRPARARYLLDMTILGDALLSVIGRRLRTETGRVARTVLSLLRASPAAGSQVPGRQPDRLDLTEREQEVLQCLVRGLAYKQAADTLGVSLDTVRTHIRAVYRKLQVHSVAEAVSRAIRDRLV